MYTEKLSHNHQIPPDLAVKQVHFTLRDNPSKDSHLLFCDFYTYSDKLNVGQCFQPVEHVLFNEGTDDFFMGFNGTREADCFTYQPLGAGAEGQAVTFSTLCEDFVDQVFLLRYFSDIATSVIMATMPMQSGVNRANNFRQASSFRGLKV